MFPAYFLQPMNDVHRVLYTGIGRKNETDQADVQMIWNIPIKDSSYLPDSKCSVSGGK